MFRCSPVVVLPLLALIFLERVTFAQIGQGYFNKTLIHNITQLLNTLLDNQNKNFRPYHGEKPVVVEVDINIRSMGPISEQKMEFSLDCYFRQKWLDERLAFTPIGSRNSFPVSSKMLRDIWRPDTYIRNGRQSYLHTLTMPNILLRVRYDGQVYVSQRLTIRSRCKMYLKKFPMDSQACPIEIGSLGYFTRDLIYVWKDVEVDEKMGNMLSQYKLLDIIKFASNISDPRDSNETLSTLVVYFKLQRQQGFYILQIYTPCTLIVVMSWVSFWINKEASPARVALGIMTVLSMSTIGFGLKSDLPKVSHSTALDIYILACFGFVFAALVEYAVINFAHIVYIRKTVHQLRGLQSAEAVAKMRMFAGSMLGSRGKSIQLEQAEEELLEEDADKRPWYRRGLICFRRSSEQHSVFYRMAIKAAKARKKLKMDDPGAVVDRVDTVSKFMFPSLYFFFNVLYWMAFIYWIPDEIDDFFLIPAVTPDNVMLPLDNMLSVVNQSFTAESPPGRSSSSLMIAQASLEPWLKLSTGLWWFVVVTGCITLPLLARSLWVVSGLRPNRHFYFMSAIILADTLMVITICSSLLIEKFTQALMGAALCKTTVFVSNVANVFVNWTWVYMWAQRFLDVVYPLRRFTEIDSVAQTKKMLGLLCITALIMESWALFVMMRTNGRAVDRPEDQPSSSDNAPLLANSHDDVDNDQISRYDSIASDDDAGSSSAAMNDSKKGEDLAEVENEETFDNRIQIPDEPEGKGFSFKKLWAFSGPGFLMSIAYLDPGNIESDLQSGAMANYKLLWVLLLAHILGLVVQRLSARLGVVAGRHMAEVCYEYYPRAPRIVLWLMVEIAIIGSDMQEVIGTAISFYLLSHGQIPLWAGVLITIADTFTFLFLERFGFRKFEFLFVVLISTMALTFGYEYVVVGPSAIEVVKGTLIPWCEGCGTKEFLQAVSIVGAVIMPHNLYLHSALVKSRNVDRTKKARVSEANMYYFIESTVALTCSFFINMFVVAVFAHGFYQKTNQDVLAECAKRPGIPGTDVFPNNTDLVDSDIYRGGISLGCQFGLPVFYVWAIGILAAGQSSTMTGTYTGQFVMEGFLHIRWPRWKRVLMTRSMAIVPTLAVTIYSRGVTDLTGMNDLLNAVMMIQLPFALLPVLTFTSSKRIMRDFRLGFAGRCSVFLFTVVVVGINLFFLIDYMNDMLQDVSYRWYIYGALIPPTLVYFAFVFYLCWYCLYEMGLLSKLGFLRQYSWVPYNENMRIDAPWHKFERLAESESDGRRSEQSGSIAASSDNPIYKIA
uniref:Uncharacterized protein n=1 Tax=Plectus sambesii TaxID=2011161 RepID=A0A914WU10_9BILA